jgi:hypothetical protein
MSFLRRSVFMRHRIGRGAASDPPLAIAQGVDISAGTVIGLIGVLPRLNVGVIREMRARSGKLWKPDAK